MYSFNYFRVYQSLLLLLLFMGLVMPDRVYAEPAPVAQSTTLQPIAQPIDWQLYSLPSEQSFNPSHPNSVTELPKTKAFSLVGGHYLYAGEVSIAKAGNYVVDFKNTTTIDRFALYLYDAQNQLVATAKGGIGSKAPNPFFLRHGRMFDLKAGDYRLVAEVSSPYYIAQPIPYIETLAEYQQSIKLGNALVLIGIGIFLALGIYYGALSFASARQTELLYALFIFSNLLFNASAHLILAQLLDLHNFYMVSFPILISNFIYVLFVMKLLEIHPIKNKRLHLMGNVSLIALAGFAFYAVFSPHWINEMARFGVWVFLLYGFVAGVSRSIQGSVVARLYLVALTAFILLASMATLPRSLSSNTIDVEHYGLAAIVVEAILLALVLTNRVGQLYRERRNILLHLNHSKKLAHTDALTQVPNRYALEVELAKIGQYASLTYIDMDNLKYYNDHFGHAKGDELLKHFATLMDKGLRGRGQGVIYRVGGDEFAIVRRDGNEKKVQSLIDSVTEQMIRDGFENVGVSAGAAFMHEVTNTSELKHLADIRMYENKYRRKRKLS